MTDTGVIGLVLILIILAFSYKGFTNGLLFDSYKFEVDRILIGKDYKRLVTSGFLHVNWLHLIFNILSLYAFSDLVEYSLGMFNFLVVYFASLIGGNLLALFVHRNHGDYSAVGASGAVCGIIFASIALYPYGGIGFFFLPFTIPGWVFGILFVAVSIYGIKSNTDNIGHEAHLGGAFIGMATALVFRPEALRENFLPILAIALPTMVFFYLILTRPQILFVDNFFFKSRNQNRYFDIDHKYNEDKVNKQKELDRLLDKISREGIGSLTEKERKKLDEYSK